MKVDDFRLNLGKKTIVPIVIGGMGVNISTVEVALEGARLGGVGHLSDAIVLAVADEHFGTSFVADKRRLCMGSVGNRDKSNAQFDLAALQEAERLYLSKTMEAKRGDGLIFVNCMEKLTMNDALGTLRARLIGALDGGIDGITMSAGLHLKSLKIMSDHPRFRDVKLGIIVSSVRALRLFLIRAKQAERMPDYVIVEGPLAGGHLGFGVSDWQDYDLGTIVQEVVRFLADKELDIPVIAAGGVFTGSDGVELIQLGAAGIQVATRFAVTEESGLPERAKQAYFAAAEEDVVVNMVSPAGYAMRMLKHTPALCKNARPNCEGMGYLLEHGKCSYLDAYLDAQERDTDGKVFVKSKICLCSDMLAYRCWTCGHNVFRLKDTTHQLPDGSYQLLSVEHVFKDYQFSEDHQIMLPPKLTEAVKQPA